MKLRRLCNIVMVIFFIVTISIPLTFSNKTTGKVSTAENRALAKFPDIYIGEKLNPQFIKQFELWFNDNLGFRDKLVEANTLIQYKFFGKLTKTDTMEGKDKWLYYYTPDILKDYQHLNLPSDQQLAQWGNALEQIHNYLENKNIPFIMMLCLDKKTIYPENYPDTILQVGDVSRTDMITDYVRNNTSIDVLSPKDALLAAKSHATVYSPRVDNAHWNSYGAFVGYLTLMDRVKKYRPDVKVLSWDDFDITTYERKIRIYNTIPFSETDYSFKLKNKSEAVRTYGYLEGLNLIHGNVSYTYVNNNKTLPKALIFGDSYFYGTMIPFLVESFSELTFIHTSNIDKIGGFVTMFKPDIVVYENAERMLDYTMPILTNSTESLIDYSVYKNLPVIDKPMMWLDYANNNLVQTQGKIVVDKSAKVISLIGWALDQKTGSTAGNMYVKVGGKYYSGVYGITRTSVSDHFKNPSLTNSGFSFNINAAELISEGKLTFVIISKDKTYQYAPIEYQVEVQ